MSFYSPVAPEPGRAEPLVMEATSPTALHVCCETCGQVHPAEFSHLSPYGNHHRVYAVVCTEDNLTDYYTDFALIR